MGTLDDVSRAMVNNKISNKMAKSNTLNLSALIDELSTRNERA